MIAFKIICSSHGLFVLNLNKKNPKDHFRQRLNNSIKLVKFSHLSQSSCAAVGLSKLIWTVPRLDFPGVSDGKESTCNAGDLDSVPELGRSLGGGHGNPL